MVDPRKRRVFFSFHYDRDAWRTQQVRNIGVVEGAKPLSSNDWEQVKRGGKRAVEQWIEEQLNGTSCTVVLIGRDTAERAFVLYEIRRSWALGKGLVGIHIYGLQDRHGMTSCFQGSNPFEKIVVSNGSRRTTLDRLVKAYNPAPWWNRSEFHYDSIRQNIAQWVEEGINTRATSKEWTV